MRGAERTFFFQADEHRLLWVNLSNAENIRFMVIPPGKALTVLEDLGEQPGLQALS